MDEIDASLDAKTVTRIGQLLLHKTKRQGNHHQVICVSHRPQMQLAAQQLVGVYAWNQQPQVLITYFPDDELTTKSKR